MTRVLATAISAFAGLLVSCPARAQQDYVYLDSVAKTHAFRVEGPASQGSAVVIGRSGNTYVALTSAHVLSDVSASEELVVSAAGSDISYPVIEKRVLREGVDIALFTFSSSEDLSISLIDAFGADGFGCGMSDKDRLKYYGELVGDWNACYHSVQVAGISSPTQAINAPVLRVTKHTRMNPRLRGNRDGYEFVYEASTVPGMSGGGVYGYRHYCPSGTKLQSGSVSLIAIHGRSEDYFAGGRSGMSLAVPIDLVKSELLEISESYGIPVSKGAIEDIAKKQYCGGQASILRLLGF